MFFRNWLNLLIPDHDNSSSQSSFQSGAAGSSGATPLDVPNIARNNGRLEEFCAAELAVVEVDAVELDCVLTTDTVDTADSDSAVSLP